MSVQAWGRYGDFTNRLGRYEAQVLAEMQALIGVPEMTQANIHMTRRLLVDKIKSERPDIRGIDLMRAVNRVQAHIFIPSTEMLELSLVLDRNNGRGMPWYWAWMRWVDYQILGLFEAWQRVARYRRPPR
jgi:hypothetical protein